MNLDIARVDVTTTRIYHVRGRARVQVYTGRGHGPMDVDVQTIRQVTDALGHERMEAYVAEEAGAGAWRLLTPGSEHEVLEALLRVTPPARHGKPAASPP